MNNVSRKDMMVEINQRAIRDIVHCTKTTRINTANDTEKTIHFKCL